MRLPVSTADDKRAADVLQRTARANDFLQTAWLYYSARAAERRVSDIPDDLIVSSRVQALAEAGLPGVTAKGAINAMTTTDDLWSGMVVGFLEAIRPTSVFDRLLSGGMIRAPLKSRLIKVTVGIAGSTVAQGAVKPIGSMEIGDALAEPRKCAGIVIATAELIRHGTPATRSLFDTALRLAVSRATNVEFLSGLTAIGQAPTGSAGNTAANVVGDLQGLIGSIDHDETSQLYFIVTPDDALGLATLFTTAGTLVFPNFSATSGGPLIGGVQGVVSSDCPAGTAILVDAAGILAGDDGAKLDSSRHSDIVMDTSPDLPVTQSTVTIGTFQRNLIALRCERQFGFALARNAVASLSGVDYLP